MKTYLSLVVLFLTVIVGSELAYTQSTVTLNIEPLKINGDNFNDSLRVEISNNTVDSIYFTLDPIEYDVIGGNNRWFVNMLHSQYAPCRISFFENSLKGIMEGTGGSNISFLKFPRILMIKPGGKTLICLVFENIKELLGQNSWDVSFELWYAKETDISKALTITKYKSLEQQFEKSVVCTDFIIINIPSSNLRESFPLKTTDSSLYLYKEGEKVKESYLTDYDYIISFFKNQIHNFINRN